MVFSSTLVVAVFALSLPHFPPVRSEPTPPDSSAIPWTNQTMYKSLQYSRASYCPTSRIPPWNCTACGGDIGNLKVTHTQGDDLSESYTFTGVDLEDSVIVVAFRGSQNIPNWIYDLDFDPAGLSPMLPEVKGVLVHRGFRDGYIQLQRGVLSSVSSLMTQYPGFPVLVTGHSLGAAEACMASIDIAVTLGARVTAFTFGEPRVGNKAFSEYYRSFGPGVLHDWRAVETKDIVPHLPLKPLMEFYHVPEEIWRQSWNEWHAPGTPLSCDGTGEDPKCSDSIGLEIDWIRGAHDHTHYFGVETGCSVWPTGAGPH